MYEFLKGRLFFTRFILLAATLALISVGLLTIYAIGNPVEESVSTQNDMLEGYWKKQVVFAGVAAAGFLVVNMISYRRVGRLSYWLLGGVIVLLFVILAGKYMGLPFVPMINGTYRWIRFSIGGRNLPAIQPSEICKVAYILALGWYLRFKSNYDTFA